MKEIAQVSKDKANFTPSYKFRSYGSNTQAQILIKITKQKVRFKVKILFYRIQQIDLQKTQKIKLKIKFNYKKAFHSQIDSQTAKI